MNFYKLISLTAILLAVTFVSCDKMSSSKKGEVSMKSDTDSLSYYFGLYFGNDLRQGGAVKEINGDLMTTGLNEALAAELPQEKMMEVQMWLQQFFQKQALAAGEKGKSEGLQFLEENKKKAGVTVTASGVQYEVIKEGTGSVPKAEDQVVVHYHGTLIDGTVFDSSVDRGEPATFPVTGVIPGWQEVLQIMKVGSKWKVVIPSELAYGEKGAGGKIKPNSTLIFEMELLSIVSK